MEHKDRNHAIYQAYKQGAKVADLAKAYQVTRGRVYDIIKRQDRIHVGKNHMVCNTCGLLLRYNRKRSAYICNWCEDRVPREEDEKWEQY